MSTRYVAESARTRVDHLTSSAPRATTRQIDYGRLVNEWSLSRGRADLPVMGILSTGDCRTANPPERPLSGAVAVCAAPDQDVCGVDM